MRIQAINSLSNFNALRQNKSVLPQVNLQNNNLSGDSVNISDIGKRLSLHRTQASQKADETVKLDSTAQRVDKEMKKAVDILEKMKDLAALAQDKSLSDSDRIEIQTELADLDDNLYMLPINLVTEKYNSRDISGEGSSILERMRERIMNGEDWNVREAYKLEEIEFTVDETGTKILEKTEGSFVIVGDEKHVMTEGTDGKIIDTGRNVPTVKERLEAMSQYVVMDSDSAEKTEALIQSQIDKIRKYREELPEKMQALQDHDDYKDEMITDGYLLLWNMTRPGGLDSPSLNAPNMPNLYFRDGEVFNTSRISRSIIVPEDEFSTSRT